MVDLRWDGDDFNNSQDSSGATADQISHSGKLQQGYQHGSLTQGLVAYYPMEKGNGEVLHDGALDNLGQINGASWSSDSQVGDNSLTFNGSTDYTTINKRNLGKVHTTSTYGAVSSNQSIILSGPVTKNGDNYSIYYNNETIYYKADGEYVSASVGDLRGTGYHHFLITRRDEKVEFYLDSTLINTATLTSNRELVLSAIGYGTYDNSYYWDGKIDDVRIYDRALSQPEIQALYNLTQPSGTQVTEKQVPGQDQGGVSRYKLNGNADDAWGSNNGTNNGVTFNTGVYGQAGDFKAGNGENVTTNLAVPENEITFSTWIKAETLGPNLRHVITSDTSKKPHIVFGWDNKEGWNWYTWDGSTLDGMGAVSIDLKADQWYHIVGTYDGANWNLYKNGKAINTVSDPRDSVSTDIKVGGYNASFDGKIDDVRIYNTALTPQQVENLYHKGAYRIPRESTLQ